MYRLAAYSWIAKVLTAISNFATIVVLSRWLGDAERGITALYALIVGICLVVCDMAGGATVVYLMQQYPWKALRRIYFQWSLLIALTVAIVSNLFTHLSILESLGLFLASLGNALFSFQSHLLLGHKAYKKYNFFTVAAALGIFLVTYLLIVAGLGTTAYLWAMVFVWCFAVVAQWRILDSHLNKSDDLPQQPMALLPKMFQAGFINQSVQLIGLLNNRMPFFLMPAVLLGSFSNSLALAEALLLLPGSIGQIFYSQQAGKVPVTATYQHFMKSMGMVALVMAMAILFVWWVPLEVYLWVFGESFFLVGKLLPILCSGMLLYSIYILLSYWQSAIGKFYRNLYCISFALTITATLAMVFKHMHLLSLEKMAVAIASGLSVAGVLALYFFYKDWYREKQKSDRNSG